MSLATLNSEYFHQLLKESRLLDQAAIESIRDLDINLEPKQYAKLLIQRGLITSYQAEQLLRGKNKGFFIGSCKIQKIIGTGGMGKVYLAHHTSLQRQVAIKVLPAKAAQDRLTVERFFREGQVAAALNHPNIVSLFDFNELGGMYFLVMEYVDGINLQSFIDKGIKLEYRKVLPLMIQAAKGLHHAHMNGLVHRDIKPGNLMVNKQGVLKILDLGLAKETTQTHGVTEQFGDKNSTTGTVDYVSPEQALGNSTDHRSDIYSLGACCYALLTGAPPFSGTTAQKLMAHQMREPEEIRTLVPTVPPYLADTIKTMMAKKPAERFSSMQEVISAFEYSRQQASHVRSPDPVASAKPKASQIIAPSPVVEPPATTTIKQKKKSTKKFKKKSKQGNSSKWFIALGLFALLAIVIGITGFMLFRSGKNNASDQASKSGKAVAGQQNTQKRNANEFRIYHPNGKALTVEMLESGAYRLVLRDANDSNMQRFEIEQSGVAFMIKCAAIDRYIGIRANSESPSLYLYSKSEIKDAQDVLWILDLDKEYCEIASIRGKINLDYDSEQGVFASKNSNKKTWRSEKIQQE